MAMDCGKLIKKKMERRQKMYLVDFWKEREPMNTFACDFIGYNGIEQPFTVVHEFYSHSQYNASYVEHDARYLR